MDQLRSSEPERSSAHITLPKRKFSMEFFVGIFMMVGLAATAYLAVGLGGLEITGSDKYSIIAEFDNISGLKYGASVEIAGVPVGEVSAITLQDPFALVTLNIHKSVKIRDDDIASIRTKGIIGDRYVKISRGASEKFISEGGRMIETESVIDIEDIIGKIVHSITGEKDEEEDSKKSS